MRKMLLGVICASLLGCSEKPGSVEEALAEYQSRNWAAAMRSASAAGMASDERRAIAMAAYIGLKGGMTEQYLSTISGSASWCLNVLKIDPGKISDLSLLAMPSMRGTILDSHIESAAVSLAALSVDHSLVPRPPGLPPVDELRASARKLFEALSDESNTGIKEFWLAALSEGYPLPDKIAAQLKDNFTGKSVQALLAQSEMHRTSSIKALSVAASRDPNVTAAYLREEAARFNGNLPFESVFAVIDAVAITWANEDKTSALAYLASLSSKDLPEGIQERTVWLISQINQPD